MTRVFLIIVSMLINPISIFADTTEDFDLTADYDCFLEVVTKVYVNPERVFCEDEKYYLSVNQKTEVPLQNLQSDLKGYFVEFNTSVQNSELAQLINRGGAKQSCPLCGRDGYYAGICTNKDCPGKENRRKHEEEQKRKKQEYKQKREGDKKKK